MDYLECNMQLNLTVSEDVSPIASGKFIGSSG